jgi:hypothetical protein
VLRGSICIKQLAAQVLSLEMSLPVRLLSALIYDIGCKKQVFSRRNFIPLLLLMEKLCFAAILINCGTLKPKLKLILNIKYAVTKSNDVVWKEVIFCGSRFLCR